MTISITECPHGHQIRSQADRTTQGHCRRCKAGYDRERHRMRSVALDIVKSFEAAGVKFHNAGVPVSAEDLARQLVLVYGEDISEKARVT